jgi:hypothetical protein
MLSRDQVELIQQEIDGANTPEGSAAVRLLIEQDPEARAMAAELRRVAGLFAQVAERAPPARLKRAILDALPHPARASPGALLRWAALGLRAVTKSMEEPIMTRKALLIGSAAAAVVIVVAGLITGFPPVSRIAATIGGVQPAARYHGKVMTEADVSLKNPEIQALFQNDQVLHLVQSDVFREVMENDAFRKLMASDAFRELQEQDAFRKLMASDAFRELQEQDAFRKVQSSEAMRELQENDAFRKVMESDAFRKVMASEAFRELQANEAFRKVMENDAFRDLQANEAFRSLSQSEALSQAFMREAMRAQM